MRRDFSDSSHTSDFINGTPVATLPGAWRYRVVAGTGRPGVSILGEADTFICNFYASVAVRKIVYADPSLRYTSLLTNKQFFFFFPEEDSRVKRHASVDWERQTLQSINLSFLVSRTKTFSSCLCLMCVKYFAGELSLRLVKRGLCLRQKLCCCCCCCCYCVVVVCFNVLLLLFLFLLLLLSTLSLLLLIFFSVCCDCRCCSC